MQEFFYRFLHFSCENELISVKFLSSKGSLKGLLQSIYQCTDLRVNYHKSCLIPNPPSYIVCHFSSRKCDGNVPKKKTCVLKSESDNYCWTNIE